MKHDAIQTLKGILLLDVLTDKRTRPRVNNPSLHTLPLFIELPKGERDPIETTSCRATCVSVTVSLFTFPLSQEPYMSHTLGGGVDDLRTLSESWRRKNVPWTFTLARPQWYHHRRIRAHSGCESVNKRTSHTHTHTHTVHHIRVECPDYPLSSEEVEGQTFYGKSLVELLNGNHSSFRDSRHLFPKFSESSSSSEPQNRTLFRNILLNY